MYCVRQDSCLQLEEPNSKSFSQNGDILGSLNKEDQRQGWCQAWLNPEAEAMSLGFYFSLFLYPKFMYLFG